MLRSVPTTFAEENGSRRREFLTTVAAASLVPQMTGRAAAAAPPAAVPEQLKLGVASYSLRKFPFDKALEMTKACDVKYINFKDVHLPRTDSPEAIRAARAKAEAAGFTIMGGGTITWAKKGETWQPSDAEQVRKDFEYAKLAGMPLIVAAPGFDSLDTVEKMAKEFDIKVAIHNHGPEDKFFPSPYDVYKRVKDRDKHMGLCVDIGHTWRAGVDPTKAILELHDRVYDLHVKDLSNLKERDSQVIVGKGAIDFPALFRALVKIGYAGHVGLEYGDRCRQSVAGDAAVVRLHAWRPGGHSSDLDHSQEHAGDRHADITEAGNVDDGGGSSRAGGGSRRRTTTARGRHSAAGGRRPSGRRRSSGSGSGRLRARKPAALPGCSASGRDHERFRSRRPDVQGDRDAVVQFAFLPNGDMLITEKAGKLRIVRGGTLIRCRSRECRKSSPSDRVACWKSRSIRSSRRTSSVS